MDFDDFAYQAPAAPVEPPPQPARQPMPPRQEGPPMPPLQSLSPALPARRAPSSARARAGLGVLAAAAGAGLGGVLGGPWGIAAGLTGVGAVRNLYRSQGIASSDPDERGDAAKAIALSVVGLAIAGYLGYKAYKEST